MTCEICGTKFSPDDVVCPECGAPKLQKAVGFDNAIEIQRILRTLVIDNFSEKSVNTKSLVSLLKDYLVDYRSECRLLVYAVNSGVLKNMIIESEQRIAIMRAKNFLLYECFVSEMAAEFVLICLTYMLKWPYKSTYTGESLIKAEVASNDSDEAQAVSAASGGPVDIDAKVFRPFDAMKYKLTRNVDIQKKYTKIESFAFDRYTFIRSVKLPDSVIAIGEYAFSGCKHLSLVEIPDSLKLIGQGAFSQCSELTDINIPHGVLEIADNTFLCCESLQTLELPDTVSSIGVQAFSGCEQLKKLKIPESVKYIDENAFLRCPELTIRCYENSYTHKYCLSKNIKFETVSMGMDL